MRRFAFPLVAVLLPLAGCHVTDTAQPASANVPKDEDALQGTWILVNREVNGETEDLSKETDASKIITMIVKDKTVTFKRGELEYQDWGGTLKLDSSRKPKHFDKTVMDGNGKQWTDKGIYELEANTLRVCVPAVQESERPDEFSGAKDKKTALMVFKRK